MKPNMQLCNNDDENDDGDDEDDGLMRLLNFAFLCFHHLVRRLLLGRLESVRSLTLRVSRVE